MNRIKKSLFVSGIKWGGDLDYFDDDGKKRTLPDSYSYEVGVFKTMGMTMDSLKKNMTMDFLKTDITENIVGYGSESYVESIGKVEEVTEYFIRKKVEKWVDITEEINDEDEEMEGGK